jgi:sulfur-oxidizing protein SoxY
MTIKQAAMNQRRQLLRAALGTGVYLVLRPLAAAPDTLDGAIAAFTKGAKAEAGRITIEVDPLVENGNSVPIIVTAISPMTAKDYVKSIAVFNEKNPARDVAIFRFGPAAGRAKITTRVRLASTQKLVAVAEMSDGTYWAASAEAIVTLAACAEEG